MAIDPKLKNVIDKFSPMLPPVEEAINAVLPKIEEKVKPAMKEALHQVLQKTTGEWEDFVLVYEETMKEKRTRIQDRVTFERELYVYLRNYLKEKKKKGEIKRLSAIREKLDLLHPVFNWFFNPGPTPPDPKKPYETKLTLPFSMELGGAGATGKTQFAQQLLMFGLLFGPWRPSIMQKKMNVEALDEMVSVYDLEGTWNVGRLEVIGKYWCKYAEKRGIDIEKDTDCPLLDDILSDLEFVVVTQPVPEDYFFGIDPWHGTEYSSSYIDQIARDIESKKKPFIIVDSLGRMLRPFSQRENLYIRSKALVRFNKLVNITKYRNGAIVWISQVYGTPDADTKKEESCKDAYLKMEVLGGYLAHTPDWRIFICHQKASELYGMITLDTPNVPKAELRNILTVDEGGLVPLPKRTFKVEKEGDVYVLQ